MEFAFAEMPLALFSTLAPMGAGAFVVLAIAFMTNKFDGDALKKIDRMTAIPVAFVIVGFIAAFFHLANPMNAFNVFTGIGSSPLSNEIIVGCIFTVIMLVYWIWAMTGKMSEGARKGLVVVTAVTGIIFAMFTGMAYMIDTIPSWNTLAGPVQIAGFALVGGAALGVLVLALAGCTTELKESGLRNGTIAVLVVGLVLGIGGIAMQAGSASGMQNALYSGADLVSGVMMVIVCGAICLIGTGVCDFFAVKGAGAGAIVGVSVGAAVLAVVGIILLRLAFYGMQVSVGLSIL